MKYITGDITETKLDHIIHGCNAKGVMGAGVALAIKNKWPIAFERYKIGIEAFNMSRHFYAYKPDILGEVFSVWTHDKVIHNAITQIDYGRNKGHARYYAIIKAMQTIIARNIKVAEYAIPMIGCGLGGLNWTVVEALLIELENDNGVEFWVYSI